MENSVTPSATSQQRRQETFWTKYQKPIIILCIIGVMVIIGLIIFLLAAVGYISQKFLLQSTSLCFGFSAIALGIIMMILIEERDFWRPSRVAQQSSTQAPTTM